MPETAVSQATAVPSTPELSGADKVRAAVEGLGSASEQVQEQQEFAVEEPQQTITEPQTEEPTGEQEAVEEPVDHSERSRLGRRVARMEENLSSFMSRVDAFLAERAAQQSTGQKPAAVEIPDLGEDLDEIVTTKREVLELVSKTKQVETKREQQWTGTYAQSLTKLGVDYKLNPDQISEMAHMIASSDQRTHQDPEVAARLNFQNAYISLLQKKTTAPAPKIPVNGQPPISATGIATSQKTETSAPETVSLDAEAERVRKAFGISEDTVKRVVKQSK